MLVGASLVALVAVATCVVAWLLWARADERGRAEDDRAAQATVERLQNSVGRVLTSLRTAAGLVDAEGGVDTASFHAWAQAVGSIGATDALTLAEIVPADERAAFEAASGRRISELSEPGVFRGARRRATYVPIVAVWPEPGTRGALLGFDLLSEPARRTAIERAESTRRTAFTGTVPFLTGGSGFQALRAVYAPTQESSRPVGFVSAWFGRRIVAGVFRDLPEEVAHVSASAARRSSRRTTLRAPAPSARSSSAVAAGSSSPAEATSPTGPPLRSCSAGACSRSCWRSSPPRGSRRSGGCGARTRRSAQPASARRSWSETRRRCSGSAPASRPPHCRPRSPRRSFPSSSSRSARVSPRSASPTGTTCGR